MRAIFKRLILANLIVLFVPLMVKADRYFGIIQSELGEAIPYATISIQHKPIGWVTNDDGTFEIDAGLLELVDTLVFSCIGYETTVKVVADLSIDEKNVIQLQSQQYSLEEVVVASSYKISKQTYGTHKNKSDWGIWCDGGISGYELVVKIDNHASIRSILSEMKVRVKVNDTESKHPFRIHVYSVGKEGQPDQELLPRAVYASQNRKTDRWVYAKLEEFAIELPHNGLFVGVEFLPSEKLQIMENEEELIQLLKSGDKKAVLSQLKKNDTVCLMRGRVSKNEKGRTWSRKIGKEWSFLKEDRNSTKRADQAIIGATFIVYQ